MFCAFIGAGLGNFLHCKLTKHHFTLFLGIVSSVSLACFVYARLFEIRGNPVWDFIWKYMK